jgi:hypothetical protein
MDTNQSRRLIWDEHDAEPRHHLIDHGAAPLMGAVGGDPLPNRLHSRSTLQNFDNVHLACVHVMTRDDDRCIRLDRSATGAVPVRAKPFIAQALAAAEKAGSQHRRSAAEPEVPRSAVVASALAAAPRLSDRMRSVAIKAPVVRHGRKSAPVGPHLNYLRRGGVTKHGAPGRMFDVTHDDADDRAFADRREGDRHHYGFIVSPEDAERLSDLKAMPTRFARGEPFNP